jgi:hypothetical protein
MTTADGSDARRWAGAALRRWPSGLGLLAAGFQLAIGAGRDAAAITVSVAALCYLAAAALDRPWIAWAATAGLGPIVVAGELAGLAWWITLGLVAAALILAGLIVGVPRPALTAQAAAALGFGALALAALSISPRAGLIVAGLALASHTGWDLLHYRRHTVVPRSLAEFCMFLDLPLGLAIIGLAFTT